MKVRLNGGWGWRVVNARLLPNQNLRFHSFLILCESAWKHFCRFPEQNFQCCVTAAECPDVFPQPKSRFLLHKLTSVQQQAFPENDGCQYSVYALPLPFPF
ncbi:hypothetical protein CEXT_593761 [Caerostris extrusa]|uniref:Uncharacterized protein n=1 Tax=Caerostris extrusa TaxID=172846 RepID=A0AAV4P129_CAEEX|nr:hypothetical protein CEXT_593761 [Caerostris extrusa]